MFALMLSSDSAARPARGAVSGPNQTTSALTEQYVGICAADPSTSKLWTWSVFLAVATVVAEDLEQARKAANSKPRSRGWMAKV